MAAAHKDIDPLIQYLELRLGRQVTQRELREAMNLSAPTYRSRLRDGFGATELIDVASAFQSEGITGVELLEEFGIATRETLLGEVSPGKSVTATRKATERQRTKVRSGYRRPQ